MFYKLIYYLVFFFLILTFLCLILFIIFSNILFNFCMTLLVKSCKCKVSASAIFPLLQKVFVQFWPVPRETKPMQVAPSCKIVTHAKLTLFAKVSLCKNDHSCNFVLSCKSIFVLFVSSCNFYSYPFKIVNVTKFR